MIQKIEEEYLLKKMMLSAVIPFCCFLLLTGCDPKNNSLSLPSSVKTISANTIEVPFPYSESSNGEQWLLNRDTSNHFVVQVVNAGKLEETFAVNKTSPNASVTLGGQKYTVKQIILNSDNQSGSVILVKG